MSFFKRLFPSRTDRQKAELAYLNQSVSLYDLERREREIACGRYAQY